MNLEAVLKNFGKKKILVIGDLILDRYIWGKVERISPEAPVPIVDVTEDSYMLGGAANVATNIASLGGHATVAGVVGKDRAADVLRGLLKAKGMDFALFEDKRPTTVKTRVIAHNQQVVRFDTEDKSKINGRVLKDLLLFLKRAVPEHDAVIISDYKKGVITSALIKETLRLTGKKKFVAVDPKVGHFHLYKGVSIITPNLGEASEGSGIKITDEKTLIKAGRTLMKKLKCSAVLITMGNQGMCLFEKDGVARIPTFAKKVYDVSGAGDTVIAVFSLTYASGASLLDSAVIANHAAGIVVGEVGTATVRPEELLKSLRLQAKQPITKLK
ncbi:MAG: D-glycero-beta-D-manno-heptose-7-phosphate kinase [Thermodesulfovibrionales bacterium]|nr:D-glycero-beta-D-manno-heptose-7-phosphate kinase [Thermodesulfovibrionales bacterium]